MGAIKRDAGLELVTKADQIRKEAHQRYQLLSEVLTMYVALKRMFSINENALTPKPGYEQAFDDEQRKLEVIRSMMREQMQKF